MKNELAELESEFLPDGTDEWGYQLNAEVYRVGPIDILIENLQDEIESLKHWRTLALQFDYHRMTALAHLKALVANPDHKETVEEFLKAPPVPAHEVIDKLEELTEALTKIYQIEDELFGGDWDEIEEARQIAKYALKKVD